MHVLAVGLGVTGATVARHASRQGWTCTVVEDDADAVARGARRHEAEAAGAAVVVAPSPSELADLVGAADLVVPSPGVALRHPVYDLAAALGTPLLSEVEMAAAGASMPLIAVTGTNGKTTVTTMIAEILAASGLSAVAAGNIGHPLLDAVAASPLPDVVVAEVSSFQLQFTVDFRPCVAVVLNVAPDHLDWHPSFDHYRDAKARIFANQRDRDVLVVNSADPTTAAMAEDAPAGVARFAVDGGPGEYRVEDGSLITPDGSVIVEVGGLRRAHPHDLANGLAASAAALALPASTGLDVTLRDARDALRAHRSLPHRLSLVGDAGGVRWYDDSKATNPSAAVAAVRGFESSVLLAGGRNKGLDLGLLREAAPRLRAVVAFGEAAPEVAAAFDGLVPVTTVGPMRDAVAAAQALAEPGDAVLLSPGCASFDAYADYSARGDDFAVEVQRVLSGEGSDG